MGTSTINVVHFWHCVEIVRIYEEQWLVLLQRFRGKWNESIAVTVDIDLQTCNISADMNLQFDRSRLQGHRIIHTFIAIQSCCNSFALH